MVLLGLVAAGSVTLLPWPGRGAADPVVQDAAAAGSCCQVDPAAEALAILRSWDVRRSAAWATGDRSSLRSLYTRSASAGDRDVAMLQAYLRRGLHVESMQTQVLAVRVVDEEPDRLVLDVVDRLSSSQAVGPGGRVVLPRAAAAAEHRITLVQHAGEWRVARVVARPAE